MSSLPNSSLLSFGENQHKALLYDDYPLGRVELNVRAALGAEIGGLALYKTTYNTLEQQFLSEVKFQFPWDRYTFFIGSRNGNDFKFHTDFGRFQLGDYNPSIYASAKFDNKLLKSLRIGSVLALNRFTCNIRLVHLGQDIRLHDKCTLRYNEWDLTKVLQVPLTSKIDPVRWDFQAIYRQPNYELYFKHLSTENKKYKVSNTYFDDGYFGIGALVKSNKVRLGLESYFRYGKVIGSLAVESQIGNDSYAKVKVTDSYIDGIGQDLRDLSVTVGFKTIQKQISSSVGVHIPVEGIGKTNPLDYPWGIKLDLNL